MTPHADIRLGSTLYAFTNEFHQRKHSMASLIREVARRNLGPGLEVVGFQSFKGFPEVSDAQVGEFRDLIAETGLTPCCLGINADMFLTPAYTRSHAESVAFHARQIRAAAQLGFPLVRYQYAAGPAVIRELAPMARDLNVKLGLEIHAPHTVDHPEVLAYREMYAQVGSEYLGFIPDFGASARAVPPVYIAYFRKRRIPEFAIQHALELWHDDTDPFTKRKRFLDWAATQPIDELMAVEVPIIFGLFSRQSPRNWLQIMPQVIHIHGKFYGVDDSGEDPTIDYSANLAVFVEGGYRGFISSEWEGHQVSDDDGFAKVERHFALMRSILSVG